MANRNTHRRQKLQAKVFANIRRGGGRNQNPPSKRRSRWRGAKPASS